jgi:hypothetical protein
VLVLDMIDILPPLGKYKYDTWRILLVKCYIDNSVTAFGSDCNRRTHYGARRRVRHQRGLGWDESGCGIDKLFVVLSGLVKLASRLIACNLECSLWRENKDLVPHLFLIGGLCSTTCTNVLGHLL